MWGIGHDGLAKTHARHMLGDSTVQEEQVFSIPFPDRPGALLELVER